MTAAQVLALPWIQAIRPMKDPYMHRLHPASDLEVWHIDVEFTQWPIPPDLERRWKSDEDANVIETWRKRPLVTSHNPACPFYCGEVELALRLRSAGFRSHWISEWSGFPHVPYWGDVCIKRSELKTRCPAVASFDAGLRQLSKPFSSALGHRGGHPDVVAWADGSENFVFMEYKGPGDNIKPKQELWARSVIEHVSDRLPYVAVMGTFVK
jgi:hypothetical protein